MRATSCPPQTVPRSLLSFVRVTGHELRRDTSGPPMLFRSC
jgi:hypothetical protein